MKMLKQLNALYKYSKEYSSTFMKMSVVGLTAGIEQLTTVTVYRCPCVSPSQLDNKCLNTTIKSTSCTQLLNLGYGLSFVFAPAVGLFILGMASNSKLWKSCTGYMKKTKKLKREFYDISWTLFGILGQATLSPMAWIVVALLDGRYFACAATALPYDVGHSKARYSTCEKVSAAKHPLLSNTFNENRSFSQFLGWVIMSVLVIIGFITYAFTQCYFPVTYYHAEYLKLYKRYEEEEFTKEMKLKAQKEAKVNVKKFMKDKRSKVLWDRISTVYDFHRDKNNFALYSNLHEWVAEDDETKDHTKLHPHQQDNLHAAATSMG